MNDITRRSLAVLLLLALRAAPAGAGPFTANGTQPGIAFPIQPSSQCNVCHGNYDTRANYEAGPTWSGSLMAQSSRDPLFWATLDVANHDAPGVGDFCLRCHTPAAWLAGRSEPPGGSADGCGLIGKIDQQNSDFDGVSCHVCHRMEPNPAPPLGQQSVYSENGQFWLDDGNCGGQGEPCRFGPYDYSLPGMNAAPHVWATSTYFTSSQQCGTCHNVTSPAFNLIDGGVDTGIRFPIERTHREWTQSDYAVPGADFASCNGCHMPDTAIQPAWASIMQLNDHSGDLGVHAFAGGNAWIPEVLRAEYPALGIDSSLAAAAQFARDMLASAATVTVDVPGVVRAGESLNATVRVTNLTGHKLPTGYPEGRRMWLDVQARDGNGTLVFQSGAYDAATGVLTRDAQIKVYETRQGVWNGVSGECEIDDGGRDLFHFVLANCVVLDNRIPPKGFTGGADLETHPVGYTYPEVSPGVLSNVDTTSYTIPVPANAKMPLTVTATLRYQTTSKEYVDFLDDEATDNGFANDCLQRTTGLPGKTRAAVLKDMWNTHGRAAPETIATGTGTVAVEAVDPFVCAKGKITKNTPPFVSIPSQPLTDAFGSSLVAVKKLGNVCAPANLGGGTLDPATWLTAFTLSGKTPAHLGLTVTDALGTLTLDATSPALLLSPTALGTTPPVPASNAVDDFACYKAKTTSHTPKLAKNLQVTASSPLGPTRILAMKAIKMLCLATDRGNGRKNPAAALTCYQAAPIKGQPKMTPRLAQPIASGVAVLTADATADALVCLPSMVGP